MLLRKISYLIQKIWLLGALLFAFVTFDAVILGFLFRPFCETHSIAFFNRYVKCEPWVYQVKPSFIIDRASCALTTGSWNDEGIYGAMCYPRPLPLLSTIQIADDPFGELFTSKTNAILYELLEIRRSIPFLIYIFFSTLTLYLLSLVRIIKRHDKLFWFFTVLLTPPFGAIFYYFKKVKTKQI
jgi:hypothetical protein